MHERTTDREVGVTPGCPWEIKIGDVRYRCVHPDGMAPHTHQYRTPDGELHDAPDDDVPIPAGDQEAESHGAV